ncbi:P-loop containing nucleoside triphosphate hydrolase protein [Myriangium duriaei CBS 260.36]|uniref:P-loop containing nucleoside triphosphate hydrolase protein n=1 Tax=Myriangium duriaei CBS 260.36 TaxID=1168546 RepID=A0A9P4ISL9_9PEZI|nr:P-loop containing nucleoside triphosphate hydrolase protein [Myriangium duriaei CBS 260.36]
MDYLCPQDASLAIIPRNCKGNIDFTLAFENYILLLIPSAIMVLLAPLRLQTIRARTVKVISPTVLQAVKTFSSTCFAGFSLSVLIASTKLDAQWRKSEITAASVSFSASLVCMALSHLEHFRSVRPSVLLQLYLLVAITVDAVHLRTVWIRSGDVALKAVCFGQLISGLAFLASESSEKASILSAANTVRSPQDVNSLFSQRLFLWLNRLFVTGYRKVLAPQDLYDIDQDLSSQQSQRLFQLRWLAQKQSTPDRSLYWVLALSMKSYFLFPAIPRSLLIAVNFAQPFLIQRLVAFIGDPAAAAPNEGPLLVLAAFCVYTLTATFQSWYWQCTNRFETKMRATLITAIHDKALRTRPDIEFSPLMLMNVDVDKAIVGMRTQHEYWATLLSLGISLYLLKGQIGWSFLAPTVLMAVILPIVVRHGAKIAPKQKLWLSSTQNRISFITAAIATMKNIKLMGLVRVIQDMGSDLRRKEVFAQKAVRQSIFFNLMVSQLTFQVCVSVMYGAFAVATRLGGPTLDNARLFASLAMLKLFTTPLLSTIQYIPSLLQAIAALSRIQSYLKSAEHHDRRREMPPTAHRTSSLGWTGQETAIVASLKTVTAGYAGKPDALRNFSADLQRGNLHILIGKVGSGKSTLLKTLIGETEIQHGDVLLSSFDISFCDQNSWLWNGTIKQNIIGESEPSEGWFDQVVWACGLHEDFSIMPGGANTKAGDEGTSLSGGQKNRISLARAIYSRKRLLVADDILAGLDNRTEALVFTRVFSPSGLLRKIGCTTLLATHSVGWLKYADSAIIVDAGTCVFQGSSSSIPNQFAGLVAQSKFINEDEQYSRIEDRKHISSDTEEEVKATPKSKRIYLDYFESFGLKSCLIYAIAVTVPIICKNMLTIVLKWWAAKSTRAPDQIGLYSGFMVAVTSLDVVTMTFMMWYALMVMFPKSSLFLHAKQWKALVEVAFSSWGTVDNGNIANRFSQDIALIDLSLANAFMNFSNMILELTASITIILLATPYLAATLPITGGLLFLIQKIYLKTSKQLRVMDLEAKAPLCTHFLETVSGVVTIRAFGWSEKNREKNLTLLQKSQAPFYLLLSIQQWLQLVLDLVVTGLVVTLISICVALTDRLDAGFLGVALLNFMDLGPLLSHFIQNWTLFDTSLGALSRIKDFCHSMPQEEQGSLTPSPSWLDRGTVEIKHLTASYAPSAPPILHDVSLSIPHGTKLAICGRTGSGKSSLAASLFGLLSVQSGGISLDGVDITRISQDELRARLLALPQEAFFLPSSTVRTNLALRPYERGTVTDEAMLDALQKVGLRGKFDALAPEGGTGLDVLLRSPGDVLTKGEQQLFAVARTVLARGSVVVIDEATSGLDGASEEVVLRVLREELGDRTWVVVAHRLGTVMDFDTVVVMDEGRVVEVGAPRELVGKEGGWFAGLVKGGGEGE